MALSLSSIVGDIRKAVIGLEGRVTRSDFHLSNVTTGERITLCMTPEEIKMKAEGNFRSYNVIEKGQVIVPKGERLTELIWSGILPGANILLYSYVNHGAWQPPREIVRDINRWREKGDKVKVMVTQTPINLDCYIKSFDTEYSGGQGNIKYEIRLAAAKDMQVLTVEEADKRKEQQQIAEQQELQSRAAMKSKTGMIMSEINNIWSIAQALTGNGGNWEEIARRNGIGGDITEDLKPTTVIWG